jgi:hypothetical protein
MGTDHHLELWHDLYVMLGTSSAALLGLLFVATSLHLNEIAKNVSYRLRAQSNSYMLIFTLVESAIVLTPQPIKLLSGMLVAANLAIFWIPIRNLYLYTYRNRDVGHRGGWVIWRGVAYLLSIAVGLAGAFLTFRWPSAGLYLVTASYCALLVIVALNSWSILFGIGRINQQTNTDGSHDSVQRS